MTKITTKNCLALMGKENPPVNVCLVTTQARAYMLIHRFCRQNGMEALSRNKPTSGLENVIRFITRKINQSKQHKHGNKEQFQEGPKKRVKHPGKR